MNISADVKREKALRREPVVSKNIPYAVHLTPTTVMTENRDYVQVLRLTGASFESADDDQVNNWHERLNGLLRSVASQNVAIWQHVVRREEKTYPSGEFPEGFAKDLNEKYAARVGGETLMVNELYLTVVYRPQPSMVGNALWSLIASGDDKALAQEREESIDTLNKVVAELEASLIRYDAERLSVYTHNGVLFTEPMEFFAFLVNGEWQRIPLAQAPLRTLIPTSRPFFGNEAIEIRHPTKTTYGAMLGINAYPPETKSVFLNHLLTVPFSFVLTQSFSFLQQDTARGKLKRARNRMNNAGDDAKSQIDEIDDALDDLVSRRFVMGDHHFNLFVKADNLRELSENISIARTALSEGGVVAAREDLAVASAFWAQLPANFKMRPRIAAINSRNLCGFAPLHNFPMGRRQNNHWGDALTMFITSAGTPYYFSFHAADPNDEDGGTKKDVGHTLVLGPTGSGKTAWIAFNLCMLQKFGVTSILFTKDRDTEIVIRALGGKYYPIKTGIPTGWNPFWLDKEDPGTTAYLNRLVRKLVTRPRLVESGIEIDSEPLSITEENEIERAIASVLRLDKEYRRLGRVLDYLTKGQGSVHERLAKWCYSREPGRPDGANAWVFDNPTDSLMDSFGSALTTGFDITAFLDVPELRTPINMHLFHLTDRLIDGRRLALFIAEFWKSLGDPQFAGFAKDQLKTIRKQNGFVVLDSQSPSDALNHPISRTLIEQTPTKILFPNPDAKYEDYTEGGLNLSEREFRLIKEEIPEGSRMFLIKQGHHSVVAQLDLKGFDYELSVLSSRKANIEFIEKLVKEYGEATNQWLPLFKEHRRAA
ncbi:Type IV secretion system protein virB4 [Paraburkholderia aspalathi]|uniref:VirB4 family type IV secretion/conjugal transfer ATPase n=1 Tax=Paraburkholderia aspalathi TaxID=1324617 RepID=UPI001B069C28|nr:VirB4 family type IV secretion/conjugal transfer ATPase [Paraburkholderia aspalathi]CAE6850354.1 Type IV secretion system protein virB4 [Paraburkholderia aspalathi]